jgi:transcriptional regulator with XRE-family HTH domain
MTNNGMTGSLGDRVRTLRKARGFRSQKDLADAIQGGTVTAATIDNIETGRKVKVDVSQLLNIAMALQVPPSYLLAPLTDPDSPLDLPNLSAAFSDMTAVEFDAWLSGTADGRFQPRTLEERNAISELRGLREWAALADEVARLEVLLKLEKSTGPSSDDGYVRSTEDRLIAARREAERVAGLLRSAGWTIE